MLRESIKLSFLNQGVWISTCVDDFDLEGTKSFVERVTKKVSANLNVSNLKRIGLGTQE